MQKKKGPKRGEKKRKGPRHPSKTPKETPLAYGGKEKRRGWCVSFVEKIPTLPQKKKKFRQGRHQSLVRATRAGKKGRLVKGGEPIPLLVRKKKKRVLLFLVRLPAPGGTHQGPFSSHQVRGGEPRFFVSQKTSSKKPQKRGATSISKVL